MENQLMIPPISLSLIVTDKCTAACPNCCFGCNPSNNNRLTMDEIVGYIHQATAQFSSIKLLVITGGECFTLENDLDKTIEYAHKKGLNVRVVTNAYWAVSFKKAYLRLKDLKSQGLTELNISAGDEHQMWIKFDNIIYALIAAIKLEMTVAVNIESTPSAIINEQNIFNDARIRKYKIRDNGRVHIIKGEWVYFKKRSDSLAPSCVQKVVNRQNRCTSLFRDVIVSSQHYVYACCGFACEYIPFLYLGNAQKYQLQDLYNKQFDDFIKIWLFTEGPAKILDFVRQKLDKKPIITSGWHICRICAELFSKPEYIECLKNNYKEVMSNEIVKFSFLRQKLLSIYSNILRNEKQQKTTNKENV